MKVRKELTKDFYETVLSWWGKHKILVGDKRIPFPAIPIAFLPQNVFVASDNGKDLYSCFLYHTDSGLCWLAYPVSNLETTKEEREGALEFLFNEMEIYAREQGYFLMFTTSPVKAVANALKGVGYVEGDVLVTQYLKHLI